MSSGRDWIANKLRGNAPPPVAPPYTSWPPTSSPVYTPPPVQQQQPQPPADPNAKITALDAVRRFRGKASVNERERCPECGSNNYFTRKGQSMTTEHGVATPKPHCLDCGYPIIQSGSPTGELGLLAAASEE